MIAKNRRGFFFFHFHYQVRRLTCLIHSIIQFYSSTKTNLFLKSTSQKTTRALIIFCSTLKLGCFDLKFCCIMHLKYWLHSGEKSLKKCLIGKSVKSKSAFCHSRSPTLLCMSLGFRHIWERLARKLTIVSSQHHRLLGNLNNCSLLVSYIHTHATAIFHNLSSPIRKSESE